MFDTTETYTAIRSTSHELRAFVDDHYDALQNAAALLGGQSGSRLAQKVIDGLRLAEPVCHRTVDALDELLDLLMLEHVHDPERIESGRFALIDPASPVVEDICLLSEGLANALHAYKFGIGFQTPAVFPEVVV